MLTVGSLCSGYAGLEMGLELAVGPLTHLFHVEYDKHPSAILAHHWPTVPNLGDVKTADWTPYAGRLDWLTAGYPCQPFSHAGKRGGSDDPRHLWPGVARAISVLRPRNVLLENVRGHVSLGLDAVLGDLADLGYDTRWGLVRASDAGAPHGRARVFIVATDVHAGHGAGSAQHGQQPTLAPVGAGQSGQGATADASGERHGRGEDARSVGRLDGSDEVVSWERQRSRPEPEHRSGEAAADADDRGSRDGTEPDGRGEPVNSLCDDPAPDAWGLRGGPGGIAAPGQGESRGPCSPPVGRSGAPAPADAAGDRPGRSPQSSRRGLPATTGRGGEDTAPDADGGRLSLCQEQHRDPAQAPAHGRPCWEHADGPAGATAWGDYEPAIRRWEHVLGRSAPRPTEPGRTGERLSPRFVEWMMGLPAGWVTDVPGLPRNAMLKALGNGVVPQQAALALRLLGVAANAVAA